MTIEDRHVTATPEGVTVELVLAGLGSRAVAYLVDMLIVLPAITVLILIVVAADHGATETDNLVRTALITVVSVVLYFGYFIVCEMSWSGRSIGKRATGLRVVRTSGAPIGGWSSLIRNLLRIIDSLPGFFYLVGSILVLSTGRNQRLGDLAADTIVVRTRRAADRAFANTPWTTTAQWSGVPAPWGAGVPFAPGAGPAPFAPGAPPPPGFPSPAYGGPAPLGPPGARLAPEFAHWDVSGVSEQDLSVARLFLTNRFGYTPDARQRLADRIAGQLWPSVAGVPGNLHPEQFIECVVLVKSARG